jgi:hypothetical protein
MSRNVVNDAFPAYDFTAFVENMKNAITGYITERFRARVPVRNDEFDAKIDAEAAKEKVNINKWHAQNGELIPQILNSRRKRTDGENAESVRERDKTIVEGKNAARELPLVQKGIDTIERQLVRMTPVIDNGSLYLNWWFPWVILLVVASVDSYVLYNQFIEMRFAVSDAIMSTVGVLLAVDLLIPLSVITFMRTRVEKSKAWILTPVFLALAALIVTLTFVSVSERNENVRVSLETQIQQAEENGDVDGSLAALHKAHAELPTDRQILAKGLIPAVTTCVSLAVFILNIPGSLYLEKQKALKKHRKREEELEIILKAGQEAERDMASQNPFDRNADEAELLAEKEKLHTHALEELEEIVVALKEHFRLTLSTAPVSAAH